MTIVTSTLTERNEQRDGRISVTMVFIDHLGDARTLQFFAAAEDDLAALLAAGAISMAEIKRAEEIAENVIAVAMLGSAATVHLQHSTADQNFAVLRRLYRAATERQAIMAADYLAARSDAVLRNLFGYTQGQVNTLRTTRLNAAVTAATAIRAASGE